jgi:hypothetical protein
MLEGQEGQFKRTSSPASKSPEPTPRLEKSSDWPESLQDIKSLLSQIEQTKSRLQEYLSSISTVAQEAPSSVVNPLDSWSLQNWNENDFNALFQGSDKLEATPGLLSLDTTNILGTDYFGDMTATDGVAVTIAPMVMPQFTPPVSVSSRSCKTLVPRFHRTHILITQSIFEHRSYTTSEPQQILTRWGKRCSASWCQRPRQQCFAHRSPKWSSFHDPPPC